MFQPIDLLSVSLRALEFLVLDRSLRMNNNSRKIVNKTVICLDLKGCDNCKKIALQSVTKIEGIHSLSMEDGTLTVIGEADPAFVAKKLRRKFQCVEIVSVEPMSSLPQEEKPTKPTATPVAPKAEPWKPEPKLPPPLQTEIKWGALPPPPLQIEINWGQPKREPKPEPPPPPAPKPPPSPPLRPEKGKNVWWAGYEERGEEKEEKKKEKPKKELKKPEKKEPEKKEEKKEELEPESGKYGQFASDVEKKSVPPEQPRCSWPESY